MFTLIPLDAGVEGNFKIGFNEDAVIVKQMDVIRIAPVEARFWHQLEGFVDFGFSFSSGNNHYDTALAASATYRRGNQSMTARIDSVFTGQREGSSTARNEFSFDYRKQLQRNWYVGGLADFLRSDQQSLELRTTVGGLIGRNIRQVQDYQFSRALPVLAKTMPRYWASR